ncbi:TPA: hypothetical protein HA253_06175 [Candidatus Woesearchaeota archaeon]|nr:hypothetical protein [Candidatus Woesearchaeota archaeon]
MTFTFNHKTIGSMLVGFSLILLFALIFVKLDVDEQGEALCDSVHANNQDMNQCPVHTSNLSWLIVVAFGVAFLVLGSGAYMIFLPLRKEKDEASYKPVDLARLDGDEQKIYTLIKTKDGSTYQSDLIQETAYSKVKISRILDRMEGKGLLERKRRGMTNIVILK